MSDHHNILIGPAHPAVKAVGDILSVGAIIGVLAKMLPIIATLAPIVWYGIQIFESHTVQKWLKLRKHRKRRRKLGRSTHGAAYHHRPLRRRKVRR